MSEKITFTEWVAASEASGKSKSEIAGSLGITLTSLYRYLANDRVPDRQTMQRILDVSEGRVDVACFFAIGASA